MHQSGRILWTTHPNGDPLSRNELPSAPESYANSVRKEIPSTGDIMNGRIEALWKKTSHGGVMDPVEQVNAVADRGLEGDANFNATRQVTVIEKEVFERIKKSLPESEPGMRRANIMVSGIQLQNMKDHVLIVGEAHILLRGETRPCELMDEQCQGLLDALDPHWNGGVHGAVIKGGSIRVGDLATLKLPSPVQS